jgi:protein SERAC1
MVLTTLHSSIVFVHGLTGDREETWTAKTAVAPWPQTLLPSKVPNARVLTFGYDAYVTDWRGVVSQNRIGNYSWNLLTALATYREDDGTVSLMNDVTCGIGLTTIE